jgi:hypothetical protein
MKKFLLFIALSLTFLNAQPLQVGDSINSFSAYTFETPQGRKMKVPKSSNLIIVAFEKDTGKLVNVYLNTQDPDFLPKERAIYIADIHNMPTLITNWFALPKLREYKHPIYLHFDEKFEKFLPNKEEKITLIRLKDKKVVSISFISTKEELKAAIDK